MNDTETFSNDLKDLVLKLGKASMVTSLIGSVSFGDTINLSNNTGDSIRPEFSISTPYVFVVWQNQKG